MTGFQEIYVQSIARAGGIEIPSGVRIFPEPTGPGILLRGGRALVRGVIALVKSVGRATTHQPEKLLTPAAAVPSRDLGPLDTDNDDFQAPRAA